MAMKKEVAFGSVGELVFGETEWDSVEAAQAAVATWFKNGGKAKVGWVAKGEEMILVADGVFAESLARDIAAGRELARVARETFGSFRQASAAKE